MSNDSASFEVRTEPGVQIKWVVTVSDRPAGADETVTTKRLVESLHEVERSIEKTLCDRGRISRTVYRANSRDVHFADGSVIEWNWQPTTFDWRCLDCGVDTDAIDEYYMVHDQVWLQAAPDGKGQLCIGCLEARLGRTLSATDFTDAEVNNPGLGARSVRLVDRLNRTE
ncbi:hypothetical protein [Aldersonia kunmingensis]|uniref:hypothetical protein n=1 Tax=Aldersonia kunmingensis TaxID=408066 RepID=UPI000A5E539F|nr:hypothetical protein [Aldersonia kunmingensis]